MNNVHFWVCVRILGTEKSKDQRLEKSHRVRSPFYICIVFTGPKRYWLSSHLFVFYCFFNYYFLIWSKICSNLVIAASCVWVYQSCVGISVTPLTTNQSQPRVKTGPQLKIDPITEIFCAQCPPHHFFSFYSLFCLDKLLCFVVCFLTLRFNEIFVFSGFDISIVVIGMTFVSRN